MAQRLIPGRKKFLVSFFLLLLVAALIFGGLELTNTTYIFRKKPQTITASSYTKGTPHAQSTSEGSNSSNTVPPSSDNQKASGNAQGGTLIEPTGDFVSNHHPNLKGSPAPNTEVSVCNTAPGVTCKIVFTNGGITKSLAPETTDSGGAAYWSWNLQDIGLTTGSWQVQAIASLNGQTKTASDAMSLEVSP